MTVQSSRPVRSRSSAEHLDRQREIAARLAAALEPVITEQLTSVPPAPPVVIRADARLVEAAAKVAEAVARLKQARHSAAERPARVALERAAGNLATAYRERRHDR